MHIPVHCPWLQGYINVMQTILIILKMAWSFLGRPHIWEHSYLIKTLILTLLYIYPEGGFLDYMSVLFFNILRNWHTIFLRSCTHFTVHKGSNFFISSSPLLSFCCVLVLIIDIQQVWGDMSLWFWFALPWWLVIMNIYLLIYLLAISMSSLENCLFSPLPFFLGICFFCFWVVGVCYIFWILTPYQIYFLQTFSPFHSLPF